MNISEAKKVLDINVHVDCTQQLIDDSYQRKYNDIHLRIESAFNDTIKKEYENQLNSMEEAKKILIAHLNKGINFENIPSRDPINIREDEERDSTKQIEAKTGDKNFEKLNKYFFIIMILSMAASTYLGIKLKSLSNEYNVLKPKAENDEKTVQAFDINEDKLSIQNLSDTTIYISEADVLMMMDSTLEVKNFTPVDIKNGGILKIKETWEPEYNDNKRSLSKPITQWLSISIVGVSSKDNQCYAKTYTSKDAVNGKIAFSITSGK